MTSTSIGTPASPPPPICSQARIQHQGIMRKSSSSARLDRQSWLQLRASTRRHRSQPMIRTTRARTGTRSIQARRGTTSSTLIASKCISSSIRNRGTILSSIRRTISSSIAGTPEKNSTKEIQEKSRDSESLRRDSLNSSAKSSTSETSIVRGSSSSSNCKLSSSD